MQNSRPMLYFFIYHKRGIYSFDNDYLNISYGTTAVQVEHDETAHILQAVDVNTLSHILNSILQLRECRSF
jgi:hypothetical protein